ncbi:MAG: xanthine dehydrogenase family protein molybdopterin-binding subunit [Oscillatoria princeps RMCB-10]|jgi:xanthine dehydrogenase YagR molybdenum-binding subunit|nr:xanthine dehydrogenase family protein molybdopterin-binding subunit [Oscillatoria princeps RMCB-10]
MNQIVGKPLDRVDGRLKVTGQAPYTADFPIENLAYGALIESTIAKGRIVKIDTSAAEAAPGVLGIVTHLNAPPLAKVSYFPAGQSLPVLQDGTVHYSGQHLGVVVADTFEQAVCAAELVRIEYEEEKPVVGMEEALEQAFEPESLWGMMPARYSRGDVAQGLAQAEVRVEQAYTTPVEHHNPIEPLATVAVWEGELLTLYDSTQGVSQTQQGVAQYLNLPPENVRAISRFIGGGFGCKAFVWPSTVLAAVAARHVGRPVKLVLTRAQMYTSCGYRPETRQHLTLGATKEGKLTGITHTGTSLTSPFDDYIEPVGSGTDIIYACPNLEIKYILGRINAGTPTMMRAPGHTPGAFALESAMDELACALEIDPIELRLRNHADTDPRTGQEWSSKSLKECYRIGAEHFGWHRRNPAPGSMRDGDYLTGWGMASATYPVYSVPASAKVQIFASGEALAQSGTQDLGTGTYTVMTQVAAEALGIPCERVGFELGDTNLPKAPVTGGSMTASSVGPAVRQAALAARSKVIQIAVGDPKSPLYQCSEEEITVESGRLFLRQDPSKGETYADILTRHGLESVEADSQTSRAEKKQYAMHSFGAHFAEVKVDSMLGEVRVTRMLGVYGAGRILNPKTARSQMIGGMIGGIGMALMEKTVIDPNKGRIVSANLSDYLIPAHADVPDIEVVFVDEYDPHVNALGTKGIGELSIIGVAAAIANAVYHATGLRLRDLPITPDKLL